MKIHIDRLIGSAFGVEFDAKKYKVSVFHNQVNVVSRKHECTKQRICFYFMNRYLQLNFS